MSVTDGGDAKLAGCQRNFRGINRMAARIVYDKMLLRVYLAEHNEPWQECFVVRRVHLKRGGFFGVTAATGDLADNHDMISFKVNDPTPMSAAEELDIQRRIEMVRPFLSLE